MSSSLYVALSGQVAMERRLTTVANNVANLSTAGYRGEERDPGGGAERVSGRCL